MQLERKIALASDVLELMYRSQRERCDLNEGVPCGVISLAVIRQQDLRDALIEEAKMERRTGMSNFTER